MFIRALIVSIASAVERGKIAFYRRPNGFSKGETAAARYSLHRTQIDVLERDTAERGRRRKRISVPNNLYVNALSAYRFSSPLFFSTILRRSRSAPCLISARKRHNISFVNNLAAFGLTVARQPTPAAEEQ